MSDYRQRIKRTQNEALQRKSRRPRHWVSEIDVSDFLEFTGDAFDDRIVKPLEASVLAKARKGQTIQPLTVPTRATDVELKRAEILPSGVRLLVAHRYFVDRDESRYIARADAIFA